MIRVPAEMSTRCLFRRETAQRADQPSSMLMMNDTEALKKRLGELTDAHRRLDEAISASAGKSPFDQLEIQRLKKRKLALKDEIARVEVMIVPDIIA